MNATQCCLKLKLYRDANELAEEVLKHEQMNVKMIYRKGKALMHLGEYRSAVKILVEAAKIQPNDKMIRNKIEKTKVSQSNQKL